MLEIVAGRYLAFEFQLDIEFTLKSGEICAVLGPSGAGKTTLLNLVSGFESLSSGKVWLNGKDITRISPASRSVTMVFQDGNVFPHLDLWSNVALGVAPSLQLSDVQRELVDESIMRVGLLRLARRKPGDVSGGERQRVALARMLVRESHVLLLDEPFAALDPGLRQEMLLLVSDLVKERNLICLLVSHQPEEIKSAVNSVIYVDDGRARKMPSKEEFFSINSDPLIARYLGTSLRN